MWYNNSDLKNQISIINKRRKHLMKNKCYQESKMKKQLIQMRKEGREYVIWKLSSIQLEELKRIGYRVEPFIYLIETRTFYDIRSVRSTLLKDIHYAKKRKKYNMVRKLKATEIELLEELGIKYKPLKYKIYLCK